VVSWEVVVVARWEDEYAYGFDFDVAMLMADPETRVGVALSRGMEGHNSWYRLMIESRLSDP
jgi:hypothetical protein